MDWDSVSTSYYFLKKNGIYENTGTVLMESCNFEEHRICSLILINEI